MGNRLRRMRGIHALPARCTVRQMQQPLQLASQLSPTQNAKVLDLELSPGEPQARAHAAVQATTRPQT